MLVPSFRDWALIRMIGMRILQLGKSPERKRSGFSVWCIDIDILTGSELRFKEKAPPERADSAAKESDAIAPALSWVGF